jgi:hypothetical protein
MPENTENSIYSITREQLEYIKPDYYQRREKLLS